MNKEYIEREVVIKESKRYIKHIIEELYELDKRLDEIPAADAEPIRHGEWILKEDGKAHCSICDTSGMSKIWNYCPNCGARMDEGNK